MRLLVGLLGLLTVGTATAPQQQVQPGSATAVTEFVYVVTDDTATGLYHHKDCAWLRNHTMRGYAADEAKKRYFQPHCLCITGKEDVPPCESASTAKVATVPPSAPLSAVTAPAAQPPVRTVMPAPTTTTAPRIQNTARQQCAATTKKGARCSRMAAAGSAYCWQHP